MANKSEMFEGAVMKLDFLTAKSDDEFIKGMTEINKRANTEKNAEKMASVVANQKGASSK